MCMGSKIDYARREMSLRAFLFAGVRDPIFTWDGRLTSPPTSELLKSRMVSGRLIIRDGA